MRKHKSKILVAVAALLAMATMAATYFGGVAPVSTMHDETNYLMIVQGNHQASVVRKINPSNAISGIMEYRLASASAVGATSVTLDKNARFPQSTAGHIAIGAYTTNCEVRPCTTVAGAAVSFTRALEFVHAAGERVIWFAGDATFPAWSKIAPGSSIDSGWSLLQQYEDAGQEGLWANGSGQSIWTTLPLVVPNSTKIGSVQLNALAGYPTTYTNAYMLMGRQGARVSFTAAASTDVITVAGGWNPPGTPTNARVVFYGYGTNTLPAPLSNGIPYYVKTNTATALTVKLAPDDTDGIDLTTDGTGWMASEAGSLGKIFLRDVYLNGQTRPGINGLWLSVQQPTYLDGYVRIDNFRGTALRLTGQQANFDNVEIIAPGVGIDMRKWHLESSGAQFMYFKSLNIEQFTNAIILGGAANQFYGTHLENCLSDSAPIVDGSFEQNDVTFKGFVLGSESGTNTVFRMGTAGSVFNSYDLENVYITAPTFNGSMLLLDDRYRDFWIHAYHATNGGSRYFQRIIAPIIPDFPSYSSLFGGDTMVGQKGRFSTLGQQHQTEPFHVYQSGYGDSGNLVDYWQRVGSNYTVNIVFSQIPTNNTNTITVNGVTKTWTNDPSASVSTLISDTTQTNLAMAATNLYNHLLSYPYTAGHAMGVYGTSNSGQVSIRGLDNQAMVASIAGSWATITYETNRDARVTNAWVTADGRIAAKSFRNAVTNFASIAALTVDMNGPSTITMTNTAAQNIAVSVVNVGSNLGKSQTLYVRGSGTATNNNLTFSFPAGVVVNWLTSTNTSVQSNRLNATSWEVIQTSPATNVAIGYAQAP